VAAFLANIGVESGQLRVVSENLNYSAKGLRSTFKKYFTTDEMADLYARKPEKIANIVYANRMANGPPESGDGWRYRGRGLMQITGKANYLAASQAMGVDFVANPDLLLEPQYAAKAAGWFWSSKSLNKTADTGNFKKVCVGVNGGLHGYPEREELYTKFLKLLGSSDA
jgi:putative chitinase